MKQKTENKLMFKKMEVIQLTTKNLLAIRGGIDITDIITTTGANNGGVYGNDGNGGGSR